MTKPMSPLERVDAAISCYMLEPRYIAQHEWLREYGIACQFARAVESGAETVTLTTHDEPDWQWWEPRYDILDRRIQAREREYAVA